MNLQARRDPGSWAFVIRTDDNRWWGLCRVGSTTYLDLGRWRFSRRNKWTPLFTEVHRFGPIQWWTHRTWGKR